MMRKRFRKNIFTGWLFWFALIAAFSLVGFSLAGWQDELNIGGTATSGDIDVYFSSSEVTQDTNCNASINIINPKLINIIIVIDPSHNGNRSARFEYRVQNDGTAPVSVNIIDDFPAIVDVNSNNLLPTPIPGGGEAVGDLWFRIHGPVDFGGADQFTFTLTLEYTQTQ